MKSLFNKKNTRRFLVLIAGLVLLLSIGLISCGDDNPTDSEEPAPAPVWGDWDAPPKPQTLGDLIPDVSDFKTHTISPNELEYFAPVITSITAIDSAWQYLGTNNYYRYFVYLEELYDSAKNTVLIKDGAIQEPDYWIDGNRYFYDGKRIPYEFLGTFGGHYYYLFAPSYYDHATKAAAIAPNAGLANIGSSEENHFLDTAISCDKRPFIIGRYLNRLQPDVWGWIWGEDSYDNYEANEPDGSDYFTLMSWDGCNAQWVGRDHTGTLYHSVVEATEALPDDSLYTYWDNNRSSPAFYLWPDQALITTPVHITHQTYWVKVAETTLGVSEASYEEWHQVSEGSSIDSSWSEGKSWAFRGAVEAPLWSPVKVTAEVTRTLTETFSHSVSIHTETSKTKRFTCGGAPAGKTRTVVIWQKAERFVVTDAQGNIWADPVLKTKPMVGLDHLLDAYMVDATDF